MWQSCLATCPYSATDSKPYSFLQSKRLSKMRTKNDKPLPHLGGLSARTFLAAHWQRKPLLIRRAFAGDVAPLNVAEIVRLASYREAESRLVVRHGRQWSLAHGPFRKRDLPNGGNAAADASSGTKWSLLIQDTQHFSHEAHALLAHFNFLPQMRIDDLMVSLANRGGGVGPHFDSYDVFLLQGKGRRRWQIAAQRDLRLLPGLPLKILRRFVPEREWLLEEGDMLYLPPHVAHNGIASSDECVTWSIGFRAPSHQELREACFDHLRDHLTIEGRHTDAGRLPVHHTAALDESTTRALTAQLRRGLTDARRGTILRDFIGRYFTEPKVHVAFEAPAPLRPAAFCREALARGLRLALPTRLLIDRGRNCRLYVNGEPHDIDRRDLRAWLRLADSRYIDGDVLASAAAMLPTLHQCFAAGFVEFAPSPTEE